MVVQPICRETRTPIGRMASRTPRIRAFGASPRYSSSRRTDATEGLGTSVLDAMAGGRAVVATRAGGIPESVVDGETGLLVPPRDPDALASAILRLLPDPARRRALGQAGRERVRARFSAARMVAETAAVYHDLAGDRAAPDAGHPTAAR